MFIKVLSSYLDPGGGGDKALAPVSCRRRLRFWALSCALFCQAALALSVTEENAAPVSRFERTMAALQSGATEEHVAFAAIALATLAEAYAGEATLARQQAGGADGDVGLRGWSAAVDGYARQLSLLLEDIELGFPVRLITGDGSTPAIAVADRVVILNHPRPSQQGVFEQAVLRQYCTRHRCDYTALEEGPTEPIPVYTGHIRPAWSFSQDGPSCSHEGITVHFSSERNLANSRTICEQLMREVELLADEMAWQYRHAVSIDWRGLSIAATPGGPEHMVRLNGAGDVLLVSVPLLFSTPDLLPEVIPWVQQRLGGGQAVEVELDAGRYGWQDP